MNNDYFSFASPPREYEKENGIDPKSRARNCYPDSQLHPTFVYSNDTKLNHEAAQKAKNTFTGNCLHNRSRNIAFSRFTTKSQK